MKIWTKASLAAGALTALALAFSSPAQAQFSISLGGPDGSISFSTDTGGYCDTYGCPDEYWDLPIYYGPVYYGGVWYRGPVYYREIYGHRHYWVRGGWRRNAWHGSLPSWAGRAHYGPALGMNYYYQHFRRPSQGRPGWNRPGWNQPGSGARPPVVRPPVQPSRPTIKPVRPDRPTVLPARPDRPTTLPARPDRPSVSPPRPGGPPGRPPRPPGGTPNNNPGGPKPTP